MCSAFTPDCGYNISTILLIGDVYSPNTKSSGKLCLHKSTFHSLGRNDYQCPQCPSVCQVRNIFWKIKQVPFFCRLAKEFTFLKRIQNQFKMLMEMPIVLASILPTENFESLGVYVTTPRSIQGCRKSGCLFKKFVLCYESM